MRTSAIPPIGFFRSSGAFPLNADFTANARLPAPGVRKLAIPRDRMAVVASFNFPAFITVWVNARACRAPGLSTMPLSTAASRIFRIASRGFTPLGHTSLQYRHVSQSQIPFGSEYNSRRSRVAPSLGSATKRYAFARAAGPRKSGFASRTVHSATQEAQKMQSATSRRAANASLGGPGFPFRTGFEPSTRDGFTSRTDVQNGRMSTARSRTTLWFRSGSMTRRPSARTRSKAWVLHARRERPLIRIAHEPQIAERHERRNASVGSIS